MDTYPHHRHLLPALPCTSALRRPLLSDVFPLFSPSTPWRCLFVSFTPPLEKPVLTIFFFHHPALRICARLKYAHNIIDRKSMRDQLPHIVQHACLQKPNNSPRPCIGILILEPDVRDASTSLVDIRKKQKLHLAQLLFPAPTMNTVCQTSMPSIASTICMVRASFPLPCTVS